MTGDGIWRPQFHEGYLYTVGWYASRTQGGGPGHGLIGSTNGPFDTKEECSAWCDEQNASHTAEERMRVTR